MDAKLAARFLFDLLSTDGARFGDGYLFRVQPGTHVVMASRDGETTLTFQPPADASKVIRLRREHRATFPCPRLRFGEHGCVIELTGLPDITIGY